MPVDKWNSLLNQTARFPRQSWIPMTVREGEGRIRYYFLNLISVFIADTGKRCFVWVGRGASRAEKQNAMSYAHVRSLHKLQE